ncbi:MAG TPA: hypothetical protein VNO69_00305 [Methyloceanibacter sp.]|nr:hypothetical protein [Methyloceanibacter sp.]
MAVSLLGDTRKVMAYMQCLEADFLEYCAGKKEPPWPELDRLIALIIHEQGLIIAKNREILVKLHAKNKA